MSSPLILTNARGPYRRPGAARRPAPPRDGGSVGGGAFQLAVAAGAIFLVSGISVAALFFGSNAFDAARGRERTEMAVAAFEASSGGMPGYLTEDGVRISSAGNGSVAVEVPDAPTCRGAVAALAPSSASVRVANMLFVGEALVPRTREVGGHRYRRIETHYLAEAGCGAAEFPTTVVGKPG